MFLPLTPVKTTILAGGIGLLIGIGFPSSCFCFVHKRYNTYKLSDLWWLQIACSSRSPTKIPDPVYAVKVSEQCIFAIPGGSSMLTFRTKVEIAWQTVNTDEKGVKHLQLNCFQNRVNHCMKRFLTWMQNENGLNIVARWEGSGSCQLQDEKGSTTTHS